MRVADTNQQPFLWTARFWLILPGKCAGRGTGLRGGGGWVKEKRSTASSSMFGEVLGKVGVQRKQDGREAFPGATNSCMEQQHRSTFCASNHAHSSYKPAIFIDNGFFTHTPSAVPGGRAGSLRGAADGARAKEMTAAVVAYLGSRSWGKQG